MAAAAAKARQGTPEGRKTAAGGRGPRTRGRTTAMGPEALAEGDADAEGTPAAASPVGEEEAAADDDAEEG